MSENKIKVGIVGYGNLARGAEAAIAKTDDMELVAVFSRRNPETVETVSGVKVVSYYDVANYKDDIDVLINCGGSAIDLPATTPKLANDFNIIDSFDTHAKIPEHFEDTDSAAKNGEKVAIISVGWDPGMFSINRLYMSAILPDGKDYTFWGKGVSQGHSDAIRRIEGVLDARQYTVPVPEAVEAVRWGKQPNLSVREKHTRECYVVAKEGADLDYIEKKIKTMPNYFADYDTTVNFISKEELVEKHSGIPHGGMVIRTGKTGFENENSHRIEYSLNLDSNPEFTGSVLVAYARAAKRLFDKGETGCMTPFDVAPALLIPLSAEELRSHML